MNQPPCGDKFCRDAVEDRGHLLAEITRRIVHLHKQHFGKGPTKGRSYWQDDVITVVLRGGLTPAERTLRRTGHAEAVSEQRSVINEGLRDRFVGEISEITGRAVIAFMSGIHQDPDMTAEVFVLAAESDEHESAADSRDSDRSEAPKTDLAATRARAREQRHLARKQRDRARMDRAM